MSGAKKNDVADKKPAFEFVHPRLFWGVGLVMRAGAMKYDAWNFTKGHGKLQLCAAAMRHLLLIMSGQNIDKELTERLGETVYHWDCVVANMNMLVYQREIGTLKDDSPQEGVHYDKPDSEPEPEPKPLSLQVGKTYLNRAGVKVKIKTKYSSHYAFPFQADTGNCYARNGQFTVTPNHLYDLIKEVTDTGDDDE